MAKIDRHADLMKMVELVRGISNKVGPTRVLCIIAANPGISPTEIFERYFEEEGGSRSSFFRHVRELCGEREKSDKSTEPLPKFVNRIHVVDNKTSQLFLSPLGERVYKEFGKILGPKQ
ncbi:hypothetical protein [Martelella mangrovi]|uniref:Uncharacterized protein n=1 Tax=Martelella mangrovi TaxID=1397477 RepID=A0ABV2IDW5_9HYPH